MGEPEPKPALQGIPKAIVYFGATVFLLGGKFLHEADHVSFLVAEAWGVVSGLVLMFVGGILGSNGRSRP
jgi:hypothetical protein